MALLTGTHPIMAGKLAQLAEVKAALEMSGTKFDSELNRLIEVASAVASREAGFDLIRATSLIEYPVPEKATDEVYLHRRPIESVASVKLAGITTTPTAFDAIDPLVVDEQYLLDSESGRLTLLWGRSFLPIERSSQVTYAAGYVDPAEASPPAGSLQPPVDLQGAIVRQVVSWFNTKPTDGLKQVKIGGGAGFTPDASELHPMLVAAARDLQRPPR